MRIQGAIFALIITGTVAAQTLSTNDALKLLVAADTDALIAASKTFDAIDPAVHSILAPMAAAYIANFRDMAIERGAETIPIEIREALLDFVPNDILDSVRWSIDDRVLSIADVSAATLDNVIVFADSDTATDPKLWAHEIFHVMQYREWGIDEFVSRYLEDRAAVEEDAWAFRWQWMTETNRLPQPSNGSRAAQAQ